MPLRLRERIRSVLGFKTLPLTALTVLVYAAIYITVLATDDLPAIPSARKQAKIGLNVDDAYADLHQIAGLPHPYNSHQNDVVREYILTRVSDIAQSSSFTEVADDLISNVTFGTGQAAAYFEGSNILVRINGTSTNNETKGVLFSAHFDSVSTAPGATDDGMGVATLIQLVSYFAKNQPKRTVVFNINNGEEDGLYGAHAFLEHPWLGEVKDFLNLEGAGAGGRPLLLRASSTRHTRAFAHAKHPHGIVLSADAFSRGVVKSGTDYTVYEAASLGGLDYTFYRQRSKYHTKDDSIPSLGGKAALWNMAESALYTGKALVNDESSDDGGIPAYFDIFGEALAVLALHGFYIMNIVLLIVGPIVVGGLVFFAKTSGKLYWTAKGWGRAPAALILGGGLNIGLGYLYIHLNPFIVYSSKATVFISSLALAYLSFYTVLELFSYFLHVPQQRSMVLFETYVFWWILLAVDTGVIGSSHIGGLYFVTFFYSATLAALLVSLLEYLELPATLRKSSHPIIQDEEEDRRIDRDESNERTPLLATNGRVTSQGEIEEDNEMGLWIVQYLLSVPFPVILVTQVALMLLYSLNQTLADGSSPNNVYLAAGLLGTLSFVPLLPFVHKIHRSVAYAALLVLVITLLYNVFAFPFSTDSPLKVFFQQTIDLDSGENLVRLSGSQPWLSRDIVSELPSSWSDNLECSHWDPVRAGVPSCVWPGIEPHVAQGDLSSWVSVSTNKTAPGMGSISVSGKGGTRNCRIYFDTANATSVSVQGSSGHVQELFPFDKHGVNELRLWSRTWGRTFDVSLGWDGELELEGRIACEWAELDGLPAFDEVLGFLPKWARVTKRTDGLLEGYKHFKFE